MSSLRTSIWKILIFLLICQNNAFQLFPHRFARKLPSSHHQQQQQREDGICTNFTMEFLREIIDKSSTTPLFGWISAQGNVPLDNQTAFGVNCLALTMSSKDLIVEKRCIRSIYPTAFNFSSSNFFIKWPQGNFEDNLKLNDDNGNDDGFGDQIDLFSLPQAHHHNHQQHSSASNFPCIFPIRDQIAGELTWNATICGINSNKNVSNSQNVSKIGCHPIQLNLNSTHPSFIDQDGREIIQKHFLPESTLFFFNTNGPINGLSAVGNVDKTNNDNFHLIGKRECLLLANSTQNRANCAADQNEQSAAEGVIPLPSPSIIPVEQSFNDNFPAENDQKLSTAQQSMAIIPLVILLALLISGMFLTIGYYIRQKLRQTHYDTI